MSGLWQMNGSGAAIERSSCRCIDSPLPALFFIFANRYSAIANKHLSMAFSALARVARIVASRIEKAGELGALALRGLVGKAEPPFPEKNQHQVHAHSHIDSAVVFEIHFVLFQDLLRTIASRCDVQHVGHQKNTPVRALAEFRSRQDPVRLPVTPSRFQKSFSYS
ncbi:MAG TPA: hypothetical protein VN361_06375 [Oxalicibacterium sp.]|nr:hypothetical protein [Oxalicibacterium sp.]